MNRQKVLIVLSFAIIYIVWGSTYLASDFALEQIPAFRLCGIRYIIAAILTIIISLLFFSPSRPSKLEIKNACIAGVVFMGLGTGGAIWSLNYLDTGLTALIISGEPLIIVLMMWVVNAKRPPSQVFVGIALGMIGMYILVSQDSLVSSNEQWIGVIVILLSMLAWGAGSIFVSKVELPKDQWSNSAIQMLAGGIVTMLISVVIREQQDFSEPFTQKTWISVIYLIVFGSVAAFTAFTYLLRNVSTEKVSTNTYVNPIIAMILGYQFNNEIITIWSVVAAGIMLSGVFIINSNKKAVEA